MPVKPPRSRQRKCQSPRKSGAPHAPVSLQVDRRGWRAEVCPTPGSLPLASLLRAPPAPSHPACHVLVLPGCPAEGIRVVSSARLEFAVWTFVLPLSRIRLFVTSWTAAGQAPLSLTISRTLLTLMLIESVMPSNHLILCVLFSFCLESHLCPPKSTHLYLTPVMVLGCGAFER